jgi:predicted membrane protein
MIHINSDIINQNEAFEQETGMDGKVALRYALITGGLLYLYVLLHQFLNQGETPIVNMLISLVVFMVIISPALLLNALAYRYESRILTLLAAFSYIDTAFKFILTMLMFIVPAAFCIYAFFNLENLYKYKKKKKKQRKVLNGSKSF